MVTVLQVQRRRYIDRLEAAGGGLFSVSIASDHRARALLEQYKPAMEQACAEAQRAEAEGSALLKLVVHARDLKAAAAYLAQHPPSALGIAWVFLEGQRAGVADAARAKAKKKNEAAHEWIEDQWLEREDKGQSKASFGRMFAPLVKKRFGVSVTPDRITRYWIPTE